MVSRAASPGGRKTSRIAFSRGMFQMNTTYQGKLASILPNTGKNMLIQ
jgi:hypothetical protein